MKKEVPMSGVDETEDELQVDADQELLVAFLDGELSESESSELKDRLGKEPQLREQLEELRTTWNMLDDLPQTPVNLNLTQTTMELVALDQRRELENKKARIWSLGLGALAIALGAGLLLGVWSVMQSNQKLIGDLPILADFQTLRELDSLEMLDELPKLKHWEVFLKPGDNAQTPVPIAEEERRKWLASCTEEELRNLAEVKKNFDRLPSDQQAALRRTEAAIVKSAQPVEFKNMVRAYANLLRSLTTNERARLLDKKPPERVSELQSIIQRRRVSLMAQNMNASDREAIRSWSREMIWQRPEWLISRVTGAPMRSNNELRMLFQGLMRRRMESGASPLEAEDIAKLKEGLSREANDILDDVDEEDMDLTLVQWIGAVMASDRNSPLRDPEFDELYEIYTSFSEPERESYDWMKPTEAKKSLTRRYYSRSFGENLSDRKPSDP
jgi:hypothetical protein